MIRYTTDNSLVVWRTGIEKRLLGQAISYPWGIRCIVVGRKKQK
jgi:hypothetical protein